MTTRFTLEQITLTGTPREMGRAHGEALRARIQAFVDVRFKAVRQYCADRGRLSIDGLLDVAAKSRALSAQWHPAVSPFRLVGVSVA